MQQMKEHGKNTLVQTNEDKIDSLRVLRNQQLELDMQQQTGSKLRKEYLKAVSCHLAYLTYMQSTS